MNILEKEIEDIIFSTPNHVLNKRGLPLRGTKFRQVNLGSYGIADIVCVDIKYDGYWYINIQVVELKRDLIDVNTLMQASRYVKGIYSMLDDIIPDRYVSLECILVGKTIQTNGDFVFLMDLMTNAKAYTLSIDIITGAIFKREYGYTIRNEMRGCITKDQMQSLKDSVNNAINDYKTKLKLL